MAIHPNSDYTLRAVEESALNETPDNPTMLPLEVLPGTGVNFDLETKTTEGQQGDALSRQDCLLAEGWSAKIESELRPDHYGLFPFLRAALRSDGTNYVGDADDQTTNSASNGTYFYSRLEGTTTETDWSELGADEDRYVSLGGSIGAAGQWRVADILSQPELEGEIDGAGNYLEGAWGVDVSGNYAYVASYLSNALAIIDVSTPSAPTLTGHIEGAGNYLTNARNVKVDGNYAYITGSGIDALSIIDISTPATPSMTGHIDGAVNYLDSAWGVDVSGSYAYVASYLSDALAIIDVSTPSAPTLTGHIEGAVNYLDGARGVVVDGNYAYVASYISDALAIIDISTPATPSLTGYISGSVNYLNGANNLVKDGDYVYVVSSLSNAMAVIDVSTPATPTLAGHISGVGNYLSEAAGISKYGDFVYVTGGASNAVAIIDVSTPTAPVLVSFIENSSYLEDACGIYAASGYAYVASSTSDALAVIDTTGTDNSILKCYSNGETVTATTTAADTTINMLYATNAEADTSFTLEEEWGTDRYAFAGGCVDGFKIEVGPNDTAKVSIDLIGADIIADGVTLGTGSRSTTYTDNITYHANGLNFELTEGGSAFTGTVQGFIVDVRNNYRYLRGAGAGTGIADIQHGKFAVTGSMEIYFEDKTLINKALADTETSLRFRIDNSDTMPFVVYLPKVRYDAPQLPPTDGADSDAVVTLNFTALQDDTDGYTIAIDIPGAAEY